MNKIKTLTIMQLKDQIDLSFLKSKKKTIFKVISSIIKFVSLTSIIYFIFYFLSYLRLLSLLPGIPMNVMCVIFTIVFLIAIITCVSAIIKNIYKSKDVQILFPLPISKRKIFISKIIVIFLYELINNFYLLIPLITAFYLINHCPIYFYLWIIPAWILFSVITISISSFLSIPSVFISSLIKNNKAINIPLVVITIFVIVLLIVFLIMSIPNNLDFISNWGTIYWNIQTFLNNYIRKLSLIYSIMIVIFGDRYGSNNILFNTDNMTKTIIIISITCILMAVTIYIINKLYFKFATNNNEYKKVNNAKAILNKKHNVFFSNLKKEILLLYRDSKKFNSLLYVSLCLPLSILLLNQIYSAMNTRLAGAYMTIAFNVLIILLILLNSNVEISSTYSDDKKSNYIIRISPQSYFLQLTTKYVFNAFIMSISLMSTVIIFNFYANFSFANLIILFLTFEILYLGHLLYSAEIDIMSASHNALSNNTMRSTLSAFIISFIFAFLTYFFISENSNVVWIKILIFASIYFFYRLYMYICKIKYLYGEEV